MNVADSEVVASVMRMAGYETTEKLSDADAALSLTLHVFKNTASASLNFSVVSYPAMRITLATTSESATFIWQPYVSIYNFFISAAKLQKKRRMNKIFCIYSMIIHFIIIPIDIIQNIFG